MGPDLLDVTTRLEDTSVGYEASALEVDPAVQPNRPGVHVTRWLGVAYD